MPIAVPSAAAAGKVAVMIDSVARIHQRGTNTLHGCAQR